MNAKNLAEIAEINLAFAKAELCQLSDPEALTRAIRHIDEALRALRHVKQINARSVRAA